jgi:uncharacterized protein (TIGR00369 family)
MLAHDDLRLITTISVCRSLAKAAKFLRLNQSTLLQRLDDVERRLDARLFKRGRSALTLTSRAEKIMQLSRGRCSASKATPFVTGLVPTDEIAARSGLKFLTDMANGVLPQPPMCATLGFRLIEVADGYARFDGEPEFRHYNPIGTVHGGFAATLLDSALGRAIFTTLAKGEAWTTLELKLNLVRPITKDTGTVRAEGRIIHRGRTVATSGGTVKDKAGKLYAHASTTCMIFPAKY